jgi:YVTN family beta-propeller protein
VKAYWALGGTALLLACSPQPQASPSVSERIYVSNERGDSVVAIDPLAGSVVQTFSPGRRPRGLMLSPDGTRLYVAVSGSPVAAPGTDESKLPPADHRSDGIAVINLSSGRVDRTLNAGTDPETFALSPDGTTMYVSNEDVGGVSAVAVSGGRETVSSKVGEEPEGIVATPDGKRLFVACEASDYVAMLDAATLHVTKTIALKGRPRGLLLAADGKTIYVSVESAGKLALLSAADGALIKQIDLARGDPKLRPMGMIEAGGHLFVTTGRAGAVLEIDPAAGTVVRRIAAVGARPWGIGITSDQTMLVTANGPFGDVAVIDRVSGKLVRTVKAGDGPWGVASRAGSGAQ